MRKILAVFMIALFLSFTATVVFTQLGTQNAYAQEDDDECPCGRDVDSGECLPCEE